MSSEERLAFFIAKEKMRATPQEQKIEALARPIAEEMGYDIVCVKIIGEDGSQSVQIMAENPETRLIGLDECAKLSRAISTMMEVEDPINGAYRLEISSPGIDRPLVKIKDFEDFSGFEAKLETDRPAENGQKRFRGFIKGLKEENVLVETDQGEVEIPFPSIVKAKLVLTDALLNATASK